MDSTAFFPQFNSHTAWSGGNHGTMEDSHSNRMFEFAVNVPCWQLSLSSAEELVCLQTGSCDPRCSKHTHTLGLIWAINCSLLRCPLSQWAGLAALIMRRWLRRWKLGYASSCGIDKTGVSRRWQGRPLIGPKWEWRGRLSAIDPFLPPVVFSILDYDHFTPNQMCVSGDGGEIPLRGISSICKGCNYERMCGTRSTRSRCHQAGS